MVLAVALAPYIAAWTACSSSKLAELSSSETVTPMLALTRTRFCISGYQLADGIQNALQNTTALLQTLYPRQHQRRITF